MLGAPGLRAIVFESPVLSFTLLLSWEGCGAPLPSSTVHPPFPNELDHGLVLETQCLGSKDTLFQKCFHVQWGFSSWGRAGGHDRTFRLWGGGAFHLLGPRVSDGAGEFYRQSRRALGRVLHDLWKQGCSDSQ